MFALFFSLYYAMFNGAWINFPIGRINSLCGNVWSAIGTFLTSIFGDFQMTDLGPTVFGEQQLGGVYYNNSLLIVAYVLALITSIGIVVMAVKGIKRVFSIFFMPIR